MKTEQVKASELANGDQVIDGGRVRVIRKVWRHKETTVRMIFADGFTPAEQSADSHPDSTWTRVT